jgi:hypothetical protein
MDIGNAVKRVRKTCDQLNLQAGRTIFNEWALVEIHGDQWGVHAYQSPREEDFQKNFGSDVKELSDLLHPDEMTPGDFDFIRDGYGTKFDAYLCIGDHLFVLFNNTRETTDQFSSCPNWKLAMKRFERLMESFMTDPVSHDATAVAG